MDEQTRRILTIDLTTQVTVIRDIDNKLKFRARLLDPNDEIRLESIAYQIHNLYGASEELLQIVAKHFENNISDSSQWHSLLLKRLRVDIPGIRPAFLDSETYEILNALREFCHFFRHGYDTTIDYQQLKPNLDKALTVLVKLTATIDNFLQKLDSWGEG